MKYISQAETNKLIRKALKAAFPGVKFSVTGSGGHATNVRWIDGPSEPAVEAVAGEFNGATFDGMIDLQSSAYHVVDGEQVHYGTTFIFTHRDFSEATMAKAEELIVKAGLDPKSRKFVQAPHIVWSTKGDGYATYGEAPARSWVLHMAAVIANNAHDKALQAA